MKESDSNAKKTRRRFLKITGGVASSLVLPLKALAQFIPHANWKKSIIHKDTIWAWGFGGNGSYGNNDTVTSSSPVQIGRERNWSHIESGGGIFSGTSHFSLAVKKNGTLWTWGGNSSGQLGDGTVLSRSSPVQVGADSNWSTNLFCGGSTSFAIKNDGTLWTWGGPNSTGTMAQGQWGFVQEPGNLTTWSFVCAAEDNAMAIKTDGTLWGWGQNGSGTLGDGTVVNRLSPVQIGTQTDWANVQGSFDYTHAIKTDGTLWAWGANLSGQLGVGNLINRSSPVQVGTDTNWSKVKVSNAHSMAIKTDGTLWAWGSNSSGQLGIGAWGLTRIGALTDWTTISGGGTHTLATKSDNTLWAWGSNGFGELGDGLVVHRSSPVQIGALTDWSKVSAGSSFSVAIKTNGTLWAWGLNSSGQLGANNTINRSSPIQIGTATDWLEARAGNNFVVALKTDGTLWSWGSNANGELGSNTVISRSSPVQVGASINWTRVEASDDSTFVVAKNSLNELWSWGRNVTGRLGHGDTVSRSSPTQIGNLTDWADIAVSAENTVATKTDGTLWVWGGNSSGQLGNNNTTQINSPIQVGADTNWSKVGSGFQTTSAIRTDGTLWSWGVNGYARLGNQNIISRSSPVQVGSATNWTLIDWGTTNQFVRNSLGEIWSSGQNNFGQLGFVNLNSDQSSPVQIGSATDWSEIAVGVNNSYAIKTNGTLWSWGSNWVGQLGLNNTTANINSPTQVGALTNWSKITAGRSHALALKSDGTIWAWGENTNNAIGDSSSTNRSSPVQIGALTTWIKLMEGTAASNNSFAIRNDNSLWAWGSGFYGCLGTGGGGHSWAPIASGVGRNWAQVSTGASYVLAITTSGELLGAGVNNVGQAQNGLIASFSSPVQIGADTNWSKVYNGSCTFAIKTDGTLWGWGTHQFNQLGIGTATNGFFINSPTQIGAANTWVKAMSGEIVGIGLQSNGTLWAWGYGIATGKGGGFSSTSPSQIGALTDWADFSVGQTHVIAVKTNGTLWAWGAGATGRLGTNSIVDQASPVQIGADTNWSKAFVTGAGSASSFALKTDGTLWAWGNNPNGCLGDGTSAARSSPVQVGLHRDWSYLSGGTVFVTAIKK